MAAIYSLVSRLMFTGSLRAGVAGMLLSAGCRRNSPAEKGAIAG